ncbi:MAG: FAD-dependent oxidoreductase [Armatimonadota bacterium]
MRHSDDRQSGSGALPVLREVDVLVVGASAGAVAAALAVRAGGRRVMVVSDLSYLGEESAGTLDLWPAGLERSDPLVRAMFPDAGPAPVPPAAVKRVLEAALLEADIPFFYLARPVALLLDEGRIAGAVLATRTALCAVRCRAVVDASRYGVAARLAGVPLSPRPDLPPQVAWTVLADRVPEGWEDRAEAVHPPFRMMTKDGEATFPAWRLHFDLAGLGNDPKAREHRIRGAVAGAQILVTADIVPDLPAEVYDAGVSSIFDEFYAPRPDLFLMNGLLALSPDGLAMLERSDVQVALGRRIGGLAAAAVSDSPATGALTVQTGGDAGGDYRFAPAFFRQAAGVLEVPEFTFPSLGQCDVLVGGGGTGGAPAGIAAARAGAKTIVLEPQHALGGVGTTGLIATYWFGNRVGFTAELDDAVKRVDPISREHGGRLWWPEAKAAVYACMLGEAGGAAWLGSYAFGVRMEGDRVAGVLVSTPFGCGVLDAGCVVDATGNADLAAAAGAPCRVIGAEHAAVQGTGLSPRATPGIRACNSDHTFIDDTDAEGVTHAFANARAKFTRAFDTSPLVNSRERRQILGEFEVSPLDILAGRTFPDTVVTARSNFDTHGFIVHPLFMVAAPDEEPLQAHVPFRCLLPRGVEGVLVTGLGMSAHRDALPVLRMQADVQNQGYAAGLAAAMSAGRPLRNLDIRALQRRLVACGILAPEVATHEDSFPLGDEAIRRAAAGQLTALMPAAILLAHPEGSQPLLRQMLANADPARRLDAALILGMMGCPDAGPLLADAVRSAAWDDGWNYRGMGQFGPSMSRLDALIFALAHTGLPDAAGVIAEKVRQLPADAAFSHCRVAGIAGALLREACLTEALAELLRQPGMQGHAQLDSRAVLSQANDDPVETAARNGALRELSLARGLYLAGDVDGLGRAILERYAADLRGHFARHAQAVMAGEAEMVLLT